MISPKPDPVLMLLIRPMQIFPVRLAGQLEVKYSTNICEQDNNR